MTAVIRGPVSIKSQGLLKGKQLPGTWGILYDGGSKHEPRPHIRLFEQEGAASPAHSLFLEQLKFPDKSFRQQDLHFVLSIRKEKYQFQFSCMDDKEDWVHSLCHVSSELWKQRARLMESSDEQDDGEDMSENLLYDSCGAVQQYKVSINPTKASEANDLRGVYLLNPTKEALRLLDIVCFKPLHEWPYKQIRKYGRTRLIFRLEVGRRCTTGEGEFEFVTPDGATLTDFISMYMEQARRGGSQSLEDMSRSSLGHKASFDRSSSGSSTSSPQVGPPVPRFGGSAQDSRTQTQKNAQGSGGGRRDAPLPAPRSKAPVPSRQQSSSASSHSRPSGGDKDKKKLDEDTKFMKEKEARGRDKLQEKRSADIARRPPPPDPRSHYDEPEDLQVGGSPMTDTDLYSMPESQAQDTRKKHTQNAPVASRMQTNRGNSHPKSRAGVRPPPPLPPTTHREDDMDTYNCLRDFTKQKVSDSENVYGMASATVTVPLDHAASASSDRCEYEITDSTHHASGHSDATLPSQ